jgi:hypothetical protein
MKKILFPVPIDAIFRNEIVLPVPDDQREACPFVDRKEPDSTEIQNQTTIFIMPKTDCGEETFVEIEKTKDDSENITLKIQSKLIFHRVGIFIIGAGIGLGICWLLRNLFLGQGTRDLAKI